MPLDNIEHLVQEWCRWERPLLVLDYDGTLMPFFDRPSDAIPDESLLRVLKALSAFAEIAIVSGRSRTDLENWLGALPLRLIAEHGALYRDTVGVWNRSAAIDNGWKYTVLPLMESYSSAHPGSFVEEKECSLVWHYRSMDAASGRKAAGELRKQLDDLIPATTEVLEGNKVLEVRSRGVHKGKAVLQLIAELRPDGLIAAGDDRTDEDMFRELNQLPEAHTVHIGNQDTCAAHTLADVATMRRFLDQLNCR